MVKKKGKIRKEIIAHKLKEIEENLNLIEENLPSKLEDFLHLGLVKDGLYKRVEFVIENVIDVCSIINSDLALGIPADEEGIINNLEENVILSKELIEKIKKMKGFRNILVHRYGKIDDELAFETLKEDIKDFDNLKEEILEFLKEIEKK